MTKFLFPVAMSLALAILPACSDPDPTTAGNYVYAAADNDTSGDSATADGAANGDGPGPGDSHPGGEMGADGSMGDGHHGDSTIGDSAVGDTAVGDTSTGDTGTGDTNAGDTAAGGDGFQPPRGCEDAGGNCIGRCDSGTVVSDFICTGIGNPVCCVPPGITCQPTCEAVGTRSEGWYYTCENDDLIEWTSCARDTAVCLYAGTVAEGWYQLSDLTLIDRVNCQR